MIINARKVNDHEIKFSAHDGAQISSGPGDAIIWGKLYPQGDGTFHWTYETNLEEKKFDPKRYENIGKWLTPMKDQIGLEATEHGSVILKIEVARNWKGTTV